MTSFRSIEDSLKALEPLNVKSESQFSYRYGVWKHPANNSMRHTVIPFLITGVAAAGSAYVHGHFREFTMITNYVFVAGCVGYAGFAAGSAVNEAKHRQNDFKNLWDLNVCKLEEHIGSFERAQLVQTTIEKNMSDKFYVASQFRSSIFSALISSGLGVFAGANAYSLVNNLFH